MKQLIFYHAGCPVCVEAEQNILETVDTSKYQITVVHLGNENDRVLEAEALGVKSVPAMVVENVVFHINYGARINDLKSEKK